MPTYDLEILIRTSKSGSGLQDTEKQVQSFTERLQGAQRTAMNAAKVFGAVAGGAALAWQTIGRGAELENAERRFDRLSESIGTTADSLENQLRAATRGTRSDMELMASAADLMGLGLAKNQDELVRMTRVSGALNMNMNQLVLTLTNQTTARFDQLGVSVDGFKEKVADLEAQGYDTNAAFKEAFLRQAEAQIEKVGDTADTTAGAMKRLTARARNFVDDGLMYIAERSGPAITGLADYLDVLETAEKNLDRAVEEGMMTREQANVVLGLSAIGHQNAQKIYRETRDVLEEQDAAMDRASDTIAAYYIGMGRVAIAEEEARIAGAFWNVTLEDAARVTIDAAEAADEYRTQLEKQREALITSREEQARLTALTGDYFTTAVNAGADSLVAFNRSVTTSGGLTAEQSANLGELTSAYERTQSNIRSLQGGTAGLGLTEEELNKKLGEQYEQLGLLEQAMGPLKGITSEVTGVNESYAYNQGAINDALYAAADAADASAAELAMLGLATGQLSEEQAIAALKAAALQEKILALGDAIAKGMDPQTALNQLETFKAGLEAQDWNIRIGLDAEPVQKDSGKIKEKIQPALDDVKGSVDDISVAFVDMAETGGTELGNLAAAVTPPYDEFLKLNGEVSILKNTLYELPKRIDIDVYYNTHGTPPGSYTPPIGGGGGAAVGGTTGGGAAPQPSPGPRSGPMSGMVGDMGGGMVNNFNIYGSDPQQTAQEVGAILARQARLNKAARV